MSLTQRARAVWQQPAVSGYRNVTAQLPQDYDSAAMC